jgi:hypothetical protein
MVVADGELRFVAACSCGWRSEPLRPNGIDVTWETHADVTRRADAPVQI